METLIAKLVLYLSNFIVILIVLPCHEFAHAFAAVKCGDETPKFAGRYTLNPFAHFDPIGLAMMILIGFGWAKPVPVNPDNFHNRKKGCVLVSIAGVTVNIIFARIYRSHAVPTANTVQSTTVCRLRWKNSRNSANISNIKAVRRLSFPAEGLCIRSI